MLKVGIIGYGSRIKWVAKSMDVFGIPYTITAISDPRAEEIKAQNDPALKDTVFYQNEDDLLDKADLDGVMIGTRCVLHTPMAVKVAKRNVPLFLEKPVAITFEQVKQLDAAFKTVTAPTVISFPLRVSPICKTVKDLIEAGEIGSVEHVVAFNDVPYGTIYYHYCYRNFDEVGGLFLQKATHDLDYMYYLIGHRPKRLAAMHAQRLYGEAGTIYGGDKPFQLRCSDCGEQVECPESPFNLFYQRYEGDRVQPHEDRLCLFAKGVVNEDLGSCMLEYDNGVQASYTQNFFVRNQAGRRGARLYGYKGTIEFDWYKNQIKLYKHFLPTVQTIDFTGNLSHHGGDRELAYDFLMAMKEGRPSRTPISLGVLSALTCLWARESADTGRFCEVKMPE